MQADRRGARGHRHRRALLRAGRHRERPARRAGEHQGGHRRHVALHADQLLRLFVVGRELGVAERPVGQVRARHRAQGRELGEVDVPEPGHLRVPVHRPAADELGEIVHAPGVLGRRRAHRPPGTREHLRVRPGEVARVHPQVVVGEHGADRALAGQVGEIVRALLEHHDLPAGLREYHRGERPARAAADHDRRAHRPASHRAEELQRFGHHAGGRRLDRARRTGRPRPAGSRAAGCHPGSRCPSSPPGRGCPRIRAPNTGPRSCARTAGTGRRSRPGRPGSCPAPRGRPAAKSPPASLSRAAMPCRYCCCQPARRRRHAMRATGSSARNRAIRSGPDECRLLHGPPAKTSGSAPSSAASIESM